MSQKASGQKNLADMREAALDILRGPAHPALMMRERALDLLGYVWERERERVGPLLAC